MADKPPNTEDDKRVAVSAADINKVIPKLATKVLLGKIGNNTLLTFVIDLGDGKLHVIETVAIDSSLHKGLLELLQNDLKKEGGKE